MATPPPLGTLDPNQLLVDVQTRCLWVGVSDTVDPAEALLVCDIAALMAEDADIRADTAAALAAGLSGKSSIGHTHLAVDITNFEAAVTAVIGSGGSVPIGGVIMWSGSLVDIGVGPLSNWALCDGTNGTPDLRNRFVMGAGTVAVGASGSGSAGGTTSLAGAHSHGGATGAHSITVAQMPSHTHTVTDPGHTHAINDPGHRHTVAGGGGATTAGPGFSNPTAAQSSQNTSTVDTNISIVNHDSNVSINAAGSGAGHSHTIASDAGHTHTFSITGGIIPPYYALAYIRRMA